MKPIIKSALAISLIFSASQAYAEGVKIYGLDIPGLHQKDGQGVYDLVLEKVSEQGVKMDVSVLPLIRAEKLLETCESCCLTPANKSPDFYDYGDDYITSDTMFTAKVFAWTLPGTPPISSLDELKGKKVGARLGMPYGKTIDQSNIKLALAPTIENNMKKLKHKRLDAFIAYTPDAFTSFENMNEDVYSHAADKPLAAHDDQIICKKSSDTEAFIKSFNSALAAMRHDGSLAEIVGIQN